ncbi:isocitrate/isopropylmalate dehydrogenase family protein [Sporomusa acidovorans]|uniref:Homoisocitrate dehydrogenase n=1 Tax=Sporomusa acidovorans (strain ATCC 49682 / DSM 3132 / Mol) TaxID=1123286 RepID=A0ABZ3J2B5_SPOA4|nr:isocitrate/isopropylmalate dehydrogenase family protein [Sporomusa acidovorans]OZC16547.1 homoisocitrate dehydrogenase [Sporomusa acidovorans DSM 3132]SDF61000.1 isocitrate dehydrogenase (NAD+) [Sporomusa acidovorans]
MKFGVLEGNGIGPEITKATQHVLEATGLPIEWVHIPIAEEAIEKYGHPLPQETVKAIREVKVAVKGPLLVDKMQGRLTCVHDDGTEHTYPSLNNAIRRELQLFVNPRPVRGIPNISGKYEKLDVVIMREITEDVYIGWEHKIGRHAAQAIKLTTREAATRVAKYSFEYARQNKRKKVTCFHKANVLNFTDGLFLECFREVAQNYPDIESDDFMIDAACYTVVKNPEKFDVIVAANQYGDIFSDLSAGLAGSLGLGAGANIGEYASTFEACHGAAPDIAGKGCANPVALILSGALMLRHVGQTEKGANIEKCVREVLSEGKFRTPDLGGTASTMQLADEIAKKVSKC